MRDVVDKCTHKRKRKKNVGSAIIEMTLLIPILLGLIYFYISMFLFMMEAGEDMNRLAETLYSLEDSTQSSRGIDTIECNRQGSVLLGRIHEESGMFHIDLELRRYGASAVKNIRRWQLAIDTVQTRENE